MYTNDVDPAVRLRVFSEAKAMAELNHPGHRRIVILAKKKNNNTAMNMLGTNLNAAQRKCSLSNEEVV